VLQANRSSIFVAKRSSILAVISTYRAHVKRASSILVSKAHRARCLARFSFDYCYSCAYIIYWNSYAVSEDL